MKVISLKSVTKIYTMGDTEVRALDGLTFDIDAGELVSIMGPSGSGKSTCMNMIGCLDRPSSGSVLINGTDTADLDETALAALRNRTVGFVFQQYHLLATMTVLENVMLPLRYQGVTGRDRRERATEALEKVSLADRAAHLPAELSGGQKQRAAIARALVTNPAIILADEPTGALDTTTGIKVLDLLRYINDQGTTIVVVTHDSSIAAKTNRCIKILDGRLAGGA
jgi:putative ABC transport system ATP-binding protein